MILVDTNVVSEFMKDEPDPLVLDWARARQAAELAICVVTVQEVGQGLSRLPEGRRRRDLEARWQRQVDAFAEAIVVYDVAAARSTAGVLVNADAIGRPMGLADAQIAGICLAGGWLLATRNVRDFEHVPELTVVNPFA